MDQSHKRWASERYRARRNRARGMREEPTPAESQFWSYVRAKQCDGLRFLQQVPAGPYFLDFYCPSLRLAVEIDGSIHDLPDVRRYDEQRQEALEEELKIVILRFTNTEIMSLSVEEIYQRIREAAEQARQKLPEWGERPARLWQ